MMAKIRQRSDSVELTTAADGDDNDDGGDDNNNDNDDDADGVVVVGELRHKSDLVKLAFFWQHATCIYVQQGDEGREHKR